MMARCGGVISATIATPRPEPRRRASAAAGDDLARLRFVHDVRPVLDDLERHATIVALSA